MSAIPIVRARLGNATGDVRCGATRGHPFLSLPRAVSRRGEAISVLYCDGSYDWEMVVGSAVLLVRLQMTCSESEAKYWGLTAET